MGDRYRDELQISEHSWKQAVLAAKILEAEGDPRELVDSLRKQAESCLTSESASKRTFGLHLLRFLYKKGAISIGWMSKRQIRGLLKADPSESVRLAAFDLLGAILSRTGSKSGVRESDYSTILEFREKMLERGPELRRYESSGVLDDINRLTSSEGTQATLDRIIAGLD
jgi:hypothetical protein